LSRTWPRDPLSRSAGGVALKKKKNMEELEGGGGRWKKIQSKKEFLGSKNQKRAKSKGHCGRGGKGSVVRESWMNFGARRGEGVGGGKDGAWEGRLKGSLGWKCAGGFKKKMEIFLYREKKVRLWT